MNSKDVKELEKYKSMLRAFIGGEVDSLSFENAFLTTFKSERHIFDSDIFLILDRFFADVDSFCADDELRDEGDLDERELIAAAVKVLEKVDILERRSSFDGDDATGG